MTSKINYEQFSDDDRINLIDSVKACPILWDPNHEDAKKTKEKNWIWLLIVEEMNDLCSDGKEYEGRCILYAKALK